MFLIAFIDLPRSKEDIVGQVVFEGDVIASDS
jgi:hypothetical protein